MWRFCQFPLSFCDVPGKGLGLGFSLSPGLWPSPRRHVEEGRRFFFYRVFSCFLKNGIFSRERLFEPKSSWIYVVFAIFCNFCKTTIFLKKCPKQRKEYPSRKNANFWYSGRCWPSRFCRYLRSARSLLLCLGKVRKEDFVAICVVPALFCHVWKG